MKTEINTKSLLELCKSGDEKAKEIFIASNMGLVRHIVKRHTGRGIDEEDLMQTGLIGLLKAMERFDARLGYEFSTYAFPVICGEIKRALRDDGMIKVSRNIKKNASIIMQKKEEFIKEFEREPKISELCSICGLSQEDVIKALDATSPILFLQDKAGDKRGDSVIEDFTSSRDDISEFTEKLTLTQAIEGLSTYERSVIELRYYRNLTQTQVAKILGVTQVKISRSEKKIIDKLRTVFL